MKSVIHHCTPNQEYNENKPLEMAKRTRVKGIGTQCAITDFTDLTDQVEGGRHV